MKIATTIEELRIARAALRGDVAFVPTMGALHEGHITLMRRAAALADAVVVSIFVNPTQFDRAEDLESYPRDTERDLEICRGLDCDLVFMPTPEVMYGRGNDHKTTVHVAQLPDALCGASRPGHFDGVTTVVSKLFNIVRPEVAVFGEKDFQQLAIIRKMVHDLNFPIRIVGVPTVRTHDGLAVSSRNQLLDDAQRETALALSQALGLAWEAFDQGERQAAILERIAREHLERFDALAIDYVECVHPATLVSLGREDRTIDGDGAVLAVAAFLGAVRLIDNVRLDAPLPPQIKVPR